MSRVWKLDKKQYNDEGLIPLYRGDDWNLYGTIVDRVNGYETLVDLSPYSASGYFPSATGCSPIPGMAVTGQSGVLSLSLGNQQTSQVQLGSGGDGAYIILSDINGKLQTVPTIDQAIVVLDRGCDPC